MVPRGLFKISALAKIRFSQTLEKGPAGKRKHLPPPQNCFRVDFSRELEKIQVNLQNKAVGGLRAPPVGPPGALQAPPYFWVTLFVPQQCRVPGGLAAVVRYHLSLGINFVS